MANLIVGGILLAAVGAALYHIRKAKKNGAHCMGCSAGCCTGACCAHEQNQSTYEGEEQL